MTRPDKTNYLDETLKRWPIIMLGGAAFWYLMTVVFDIKSEMISMRADIKSIHALTDSEKEANDTRFVMVETRSINTENRTNEMEKKWIRLEATLPDQIKIKNND